MEKLIIVEVSQKTLNPIDPFKKVFSRQVVVPDSLDFSYNNVEGVLSFLFGKDSIVIFSSQSAK